MLLLVALSSALAGYGDPSGGYPSPLERELHVWTNAVRSAPADFDGQFDGCRLSSFPGAEQTPKRALAFHTGLNEVARNHTEDMDENNFFDHTSSNGTDAGARIFAFYDGFTIGENIAGGYPSTFAALMGWMCSSGHRVNVMSSEFEDLGTGVVGTLYTQDFGAGAEQPRPAILMGAHSREGGLKLIASVEDAASPTMVEALVDGERLIMGLTHGVSESGVYEIAMPAGGDCQLYAFLATRADGSLARFPTTGAYGIGACDWDDSGAQWVADPGWEDDPGSGLPNPNGEEGCACASGAGPAGWFSLILLALPLWRRRS